MSKPPWTPGPWVYTDDGRLGNVETLDGTPVAMAQMRASLGQKDPERAANARLIAAAPALAEALAEIVSAWDSDLEEYESGLAIGNAIPAAREVLAAAGWPEGGSDAS